MIDDLCPMPPGDRLGVILAPAVDHEDRPELASRLYATIDVKLLVDGADHRRQSRRLLRIR
jgi:hypothetical protein